MRTGPESPITESTSETEPSLFSSFVSLAVVRIRVSFSSLYERRDRTVRDHRKLSTFKLAHSLVILTYSETKHFPEYERYGLVSQMRRSAVSVSSNIVEGCARFSEKEYARFLECAFGSLRELSYYIKLSRDLGFLGGEAFEELEVLCRRTSAALVALIRVRRSSS
ncbi:MAG: four helix bundle protein [Thermoanaerobaculia bacterium]